MSASGPVAVIVEDDPHIRRFVHSALEAEGWNVFETESVEQGVLEVGTRKPDLVIVDLGLPDGDGVDVIREVRGWTNTPIIVLSARTAEADKVRALDMGADDYLTKPFGVGELLARVRVAQRRGALIKQAPSCCLVSFGNVEVDLVARTVRKAGQAVHLTPIEYQLLVLLATNIGKVLTYGQICRDVWGPSHERDFHYARIYMGHLREKLEDHAAQPKHITTETGVGYRLRA
jgi:two-component system KDP operon response regulator KdpE